MKTRTALLAVLMLWGSLAFAQSRLRWELKETSPPNRDGNPAIAISGNNLILVGNGGNTPNLRALDKGTGAQIWSAPGEANATVVTFGGTAYVNSWSLGSGTLRAINAGTGAVLWSVPRGDVVAAGENAAVAAVGAGNTVSIRSYDPTDGHPLWSDAVTKGVPGDALTVAAVAIEGFNVFVAAVHRTGTSPTFSYNQVLRSYDARTGVLRWEILKPNVTIVSMATEPGRLYVAGSYLAALETGSGDVLWQAPAIGNAVQVRRNQLVLGRIGFGSPGIVSVFDSNSGVLQWSVMPPHSGQPMARPEYYSDMTVGGEGVYLAGYYGSQGVVAATTMLRVHSLTTGQLLFEDMADPGQIYGNADVVQDGGLVFVSGGAVFGAGFQNLLVRSYEFRDVENVPASEAVLGSGSGPGPEGRSRVRR